MAFVTITGRLGKDPELSTSRDGSTTYARCPIGWSERVKDKTGQWVDGPTVWVQTTIFGRQAENVVASLHKGDRVTAFGQLRPETWHSQHGEDTVFTMTADTLTVNLTFATAQITRNPKGDGNGYAGGGWNNQPPQGGQGFQSQPQGGPAAGQPGWPVAGQPGAASAGFPEPAAGRPVAGQPAAGRPAQPAAVAGRAG